MIVSRVTTTEQGPVIFAELPMQGVIVGTTEGVDAEAQQGHAAKRRGIDDNIGDVLKRGGSADHNIKGSGSNSGKGGKVKFDVKGNVEGGVFGGFKQGDLNVGGGDKINKNNANKALAKLSNEGSNKKNTKSGTRLDAMYPSYRCTVLNWVRKLGPSWTVRLVDLIDGSPNNIYNFICKDWLPDCLVSMTMDGAHKAQHASDLIRLPLLFEHDDVWMDVCNMLHTHLDDLFWNALSDSESRYEIGLWIITSQIRKKWGSFGNFMCAARKESIFIKNWYNGFKE
ncbi:hypothetical protein EsH8_XIII_000005 [Colletotrichum jinshuiense]